MPSDGTPRVAFREGDLATAFAARRRGEESISTVADRDLHRYYALLARALPTFTEAEASLLVDALNGLITEPHTAHLLWANIEDALGDGLAEKWGVDGPALVARLRALTPFAALAVADAAERWWNGPHTDEARAASLRAVGLTKGEHP